MNLKDITLSERSQLQKMEYYISPFMWNFEKKKYSDEEHTSGCQGMELWGGCDYEKVMRGSILEQCSRSVS